MGEAGKRKRRIPEETASVPKRVLPDRAEDSKVCGEAGRCPSRICRWQKTLFDSSALVFERSNGSVDKRVKAAEAKVSQPQAKLRRKDEVLSELMEEHLRTKKAPGDL